MARKIVHFEEKYEMKKTIAWTMIPFLQKPINIFFFSNTIAWFFFTVTLSPIKKKKKNVPSEISL